MLAGRLDPDRLAERADAMVATAVGAAAAGEPAALTLDRDGPRVNHARVAADEVGDGQGVVARGVDAVKEAQRLTGVGLGAAAAAVVDPAGHVRGRFVVDDDVEVIRRAALARPERDE